MPQPEKSPPVASARPQVTAELMARTGLDEEMLRDLVHAFYDKVQADPKLAPVFAARISDWEPHLERMTAFWSSVALMTGRYHGRPMEAHLPLPVGGEHFERWLELFRRTAAEICPPAGVEHLLARAEKIAEAIRTNMEDARTGNGLHGAPPKLRARHAPADSGP